MLQDEDEFWTMEAAVRTVCNIFSGIPRLNYFLITLNERGFDAQPFSPVLESFTLLRNIQNVFLSA
jgi:hypothetical protein